MDIKKYETAKFYRGKIEDINRKITVVKKMDRSTGNSAFVELQNIAIDVLCELREGYERKFEEL